MNKLLFFGLIFSTNFLFSQNDSKTILNREEDYFKRIATKYDVLLKEWGNPDKTDFNSYDNSNIAKYQEKNLFGYYAFLSNKNNIFKVIHLIQGSTNDKSNELYDKYSRTFEEAGFKFEKLPDDGFTTKAIKYFKDGIIINHNLFRAPKEGKYPGKDIQTIETTITQ